jgi:hypothetical protein
MGYLKIPFGIAGMSLATGIVGTKLNSPGLINASETSSKFISPAISIGIGGQLISNLKKLNRRK